MTIGDDEMEPAVNPALTAMADALRVGDHLLERMAAAPARAEPAFMA